MSSRSSIFAFDYNRFLNVVIPAFRAGRENELIQEEIKRYDYSYAKFENLDKVVNLLNEDFTNCIYGKLFAADINGVYQTNRRFEKPHPKSWSYEDFAILLERMILRHCAKYYLGLGKISRLELVVTSTNEMIKKKLNKLCDGSHLWAHCSADSDGIYGWLDGDEVKCLNDNADAIISIQRSRRPERNELVIKSFKGIIEVASSNDLGLLFGNSLSLELIGNNKYFQLNELVKANDFLACEPCYNLKLVNDYRLQ